MAVIVALCVVAAVLALYGAWRLFKFFVELVGKAPMNDA